MKIFLISILFSVVFTQDCGTPLECFTKALELLKKDREEMKNERQHYETLFNSVSEKLEGLSKYVNNTFSELNKKVEALQVLPSQLSNLTSEIALAKSDITGKTDQLRTELNAPFQNVFINLGDFRITTNLISVPLNVPKNSNKVVVYATVHIGGSFGGNGFVRIFTKCNGIEQNRMLEYTAYDQNAWSTNSDNLELPLDGTDSNLYFVASGYVGGNGGMSLRVVGWK